MESQLPNSSSDEGFWDLANSSSDEELLNMQIALLQEERGRRRRRRSIFSCVYKNRERLQGHQKLYHDYFSENPIHGDDVFRMRFRMHRALFLRIVEGVTAHDTYLFKREMEQRPSWIIASTKVYSCNENACIWSWGRCC